MQSRAKTVAAYLAELPAERRAALTAVRKVILANLDDDLEEGMGYGMISYHVPHRVYPAGYHCDPKQPLPFACLAAQKNHMSLYLMTVYGDGAEERWLRESFAAAGKKLDMGKSCIRFRRAEDLPLDVIGEAFRRVPVARYIEFCERTFAAKPAERAARRSKAASAKPTARKKKTKTPPAKPAAAAARRKA